MAFWIKSNGYSACLGCHKSHADITESRAPIETLPADFWGAWAMSYFKSIETVLLLGRQKKQQIICISSYKGDISPFSSVIVNIFNGNEVERWRQNLGIH